MSSLEYATYFYGCYRSQNSVGEEQSHISLSQFKKQAYSIRLFCYLFRLISILFLPDLEYMLRKRLERFSLCLDSFPLLGVAKRVRILLEGLVCRSIYEFLCMLKGRKFPQSIWFAMLYLWFIYYNQTSKHIILEMDKSNRSKKQLIFQFLQQAKRRKILKDQSQKNSDFTL